MPSELDNALLLHRIPLFRDIAPDVLLPVAHFSSRIQLDKHEILFQQGDFGDALYLVIEGRLAVVLDDHVISEIAKNECVGELAVLDWEPRSATVKALQATTLLRLDRNDLMDLLQSQPVLLHALIGVLSKRLRNNDR